MKYNIAVSEQYKCKKIAFGFSNEKMAEISQVALESYEAFERGEWIDRNEYRKILNNVEEYIRALPKEQYLSGRLVEEVLIFRKENESDHLKTITHMQIHVAKLAMLYVNRAEDPDWRD